MPAKSEKQRRLFAAAYRDPDVRKRLGVSKQTAHEFMVKDDRAERYIDAVSRGDSDAMSAVFKEGK